MAVLKNLDYSGGQAEIQNGCDPNAAVGKFIYRGQIKRMTPKDSGVEIEFDWLAKLEDGAWKKVPNVPFFIDLQSFSCTNIGPGREGSDRLFFANEKDQIVTLFPPDGSKLDYERVQV